MQKNNFVKQFLFSTILICGLYESGLAFAAPNSPTNVIAIVPGAATSTSGYMSTVKVTWDDNSVDETGFSFTSRYNTITSYPTTLYPVPGSVYPTGSSTGVRSATFNTIMATGTIPMYIGVSSFNASGVSVESFSNPFTGGSAPTAPAAVMVTASSTISTGTTIPVTVSWMDMSNNESGFAVTPYFASNNAPVPMTGSGSCYAPANATSCTFGNAPTFGVPATTTPLYFVVSAVNSYGNASAKSAILSIMNNVTPVTPTTPLPPVIVTPVPTPIPTPSLPLSAPAYITTALYSYSTKTASGTIIRNNYIYSYWAKVPDATGYVLERTNAKGGTVGYKSISLPSSLTSYFDMTVSSGMSYIYKIKAIKSTQSSAFTSSKVMIIP